MRWLRLVLLAAIAPSALAGADVSGSIAAEIRQFLQSAPFPGQSSASQLSLVAEPEFRWRSDDRRHRVTVVPFARLDSVDDERTHVDLREGYYAYSKGGFEILAGVNKVFWGVTESRHLVDIINQNDVVEDVDLEDKLGAVLAKRS